MKTPDIQELIDKAMAGRLSAEERSRWSILLAENPELEEDAALGRALQSLPPPPVVSTNFTARVLAEVNRPQPAYQRRSWIDWLRWPRLATAAATLAVAFVVIQQQQRQQMVNTARTFAGVVSEVGSDQNVQPEAVVTALKDFEAIRRLPDSAPVDYGLLAALRSTE